MSDRKYRQRGYQDEPGRERPRSPRPAGPIERDPARGPRGRGLGAPTETVFKCAACGARQEAPAPAAYDAKCARCGADLHTCATCVYFDTGVRNECRQGGAVLPDGSGPLRVAGKTKRNDCTLFAPKTVQEFAADKPDKPRPDDPRAAFDALFK
jgi:hypothetical protein